MNGPFDFGWALKMLKLGYAVQRAGWNDKGMWVAMSPGIEFAPETAREGAAAHRAREMAAAGHTGPIVTFPRLDMRAADGSLVIGWLASQTDMLADDWSVVA